MKKVLKIAGKGLLAILILLIAFLLILFVYHRIMLAQEETLLERYPGALVEVDGHSMNIYTEGEGDHTLVFLAGAGDCSPVMSFKPLYTALSDTCRTVVVEKFGYGMSDITDAGRDYAVMVDECREGLQKAGIEAPYILCPYSKSGLDALIWAQKYPEEVEAIISLDMAFPAHYADVAADAKDSSQLMGVVRGMGIVRLFTDDSGFGETYTEDDIAMVWALINRKYGNKAMFGEIAAIPDAVSMIESAPRPELPMKLFLSDGGGTGMDAQTWRGVTYAYTEGISDVSYMELNCSHGEIFRKETETLTAEIRAFIKER